MNAEQKAKELVEKFRLVQITKIKNDGWKLLFEAEEEEIIKHAKQCALIAVEEVLSAVQMYTGNLNPTWKLYDDVKQTILKM